MSQREVEHSTADSLKVYMLQTAGFTCIDPQVCQNAGMQFCIHRKIICVNTLLSCDYSKQRERR